MSDSREELDIRSVLCLFGRNTQSMASLVAPALTFDLSHSYADAPMPSGDGQKLVLAKPYEESQMFHEFLSYIMGQETDPNFPPDSEVRYAQTRECNSPHVKCPLGDCGRGGEHV